MHQMDDLKGTGPTEVGKECMAQEERARADPTLSSNLHPIAFGKAVATDAAKLALNIAVLTQQMAEANRYTIAVLDVGVKLGEQLDAETKRADSAADLVLAYERRLDDVTRNYEGRISAGMHENERLKGRVDEEVANVIEANNARARLVRDLEGAEARIAAAVAAYDRAKGEEAAAVAHAVELVNQKAALRDHVDQLDHQLRRARDAVGETQLRVDLAHASTERDRLIESDDAVRRVLIERLYLPEGADWPTILSVIGIMQEEYGAEVRTATAASRARAQLEPVAR